MARLSLPGALLKLRSDEQLVALFRAGSDEAFRVIHDRYRQRLFAYVRQMLAGSRSDAEDALQDVFLRAYNALRADERPIALKAWLYRVAHNRCIDQLRRPVPAPAEVFEMSRPLMPDPLAETERRDDLRRLVADVQRLPQQQRSALLMREMEGLSYAELADALEVTVPAVKSLLVRARIGLVESAEARDVACSDIRGDLALSFGRGVRASAQARRHMRDCCGCREYRSQLRAVKSDLGALLPGPGPLALVAKLFGVGAGAGAGGGGAAVVGGGAAAGLTAKVAAIVCCAAVVGGGAAELRDRTGGPGAALERDGQTTSVKRDRPADATSFAPAPSAPDRHAPVLSIRTETARPKAVTRSAARDLRLKAAAAPVSARAVPEDEPITPHFRPSTAAGTTATEEPSTGGAAGPAEPEAETGATTGTSSSGTGPTASATTGTAVSTTGAVGDEAATGTTTQSGSSPDAATASASSTEGDQTSTSSTGSQGTTTTAPSGGSGRR
jgi:RNA polymerase sigma factor (sigma-70 family)